MEGRPTCRQAEKKNRNTEREQEKDIVMEKGGKFGAAQGPLAIIGGAAVPGEGRDTGSAGQVAQPRCRRRAVAPGAGHWDRRSKAFQAEALLLQGSSAWAAWA